MPTIEEIVRQYENWEIGYDAAIWLLRFDHRLSEVEADKLLLDRGGD